MTMKPLLKRVLFSVAPMWATSFFSGRARAHSHRVIAGWGSRRVNETLFQRFGSRVLSGPFQGMELSAPTRAEQIGPYLLGLYESELHPTWETLLRGRFAQIVDVGAKFGYYAVGLARRFPHSRVTAFDTDHWARRVLKEMVRDNGTSNVEIRGYCSPGWLARNLTEGALVLSDCEGFEGDLFASVPIPNLASATLVIETHEETTPGISQRLRERLEPTHLLTEVPTDTHPRVSPVDLSVLSFSEREQFLATQEVRHGRQVWLVGVPRP